MPVNEISSAPVRTTPSRRLLGAGSLGALGIVSLALLTACGSGSSTGSTAAAANAPTAAPSGAAAGAGGMGGPAASGLIAAADGSTLQVQSQQNGQVAVTWAAATTFTQQVKVVAAAIKAGDCVTAASTSGDAASTSFTATTVRVTQAVDGSCDNGFGGGGAGARPSGAPTGGGFPAGGAMPSGAPTGSATRTGSVASGAVVSVSGSTLVVAARQFTPGAASSSAAAPATTNETVTLAASTTITSQEKATSAAATVGRCATAQGTADSSGAVTATSISVTDAVDGTCSTGFGGGFGGPPGGGAAVPSGTTSG